MEQHEEEGADVLPVRKSRQGARPTITAAQLDWAEAQFASSSPTVAKATVSIGTLGTILSDWIGLDWIGFRRGYK